MSRARLTTVILAVVLAAPAPLAAQASHAERMASARQRVRSADSLHQVRRAAYDSARLAAAPPETWVVLREGAFAVRASAAIAEPVREAMRQVMAVAETRGGSALAARLATHLPTVTLDTSMVRRFGAAVRIVGDTSRPRMEMVRRAIGRRLGAHDLVPQLTTLVDAFALDRADSALSVWTLARRLPMGEPNAEEWTDAYLDLATSESFTLRQCGRGVANACLLSLGIVSDAATSVETWYAPEDYRPLVREVGYTFASRQSPTEMEAVRACINRHDIASCQTVVTRMPPARVPAPLGAEARRTFLDEVFRAGGEGAYERLLVTPGTVRERLSAAAGLPLEQVATRWRERVMRSRPADVQVSPALLLSTIAWCGAFVGIAAVRRSA